MEFHYLHYQEYLTHFLSDLILFFLSIFFKFKFLYNKTGYQITVGEKAMAHAIKAVGEKVMWAF